MSDINHKPQRLASAVYLLTSFFGDQEPLKWRLRSLSGHLVSSSISLNGHSSHDDVSVAFELRKVVSEILALIGVARDAGLISPDNHRLIAHEYTKFTDSLALSGGLSSERGLAMLSPEFFSLPALALEKEKETESKMIPAVSDKIIRTGEIKEKKSTPDLISPIHPLTESLNYSKKIAAKPLKKFGAVSVKKNGRQSVIISLLKRKKEIMIKDVSPLINGCSEKTIQRELLEMVSVGLLKKMGEKRWSRYTLA